MMTIKKLTGLTHLCFCVFCLLFTVSSINAQVGDGVGTSGGEILNIYIGSRAASMGGAYTAFSDDASGSFWNPSGLADSYALQFQFGHSSWYQDISLEYLGASVPVSDRFTAGLGVIYFNYGDFAGYNEYDQPTGSFSGHNMVLSLSLAYRLSDNLSAGITAKGITEKLDSYDANGYAFDFGVKYNWNVVSLGLTAKNIGSGLKYESEVSPFPTKYTAGIGVRTLDNMLCLASDINIPRDGYISLHHGIEYQYLNSIIVRSGYSYSTSQENSEKNGMIFGFGLKILKGSIDYSYMPNNDLGAVHKIDFSLKLPD